MSVAPGSTRRTITPHSSLYLVPPHMLRRTVPAGADVAHCVCRPHSSAPSGRDPHACEVSPQLHFRGSSPRKMLCGQRRIAAAHSAVSSSSSHKRFTAYSRFANYRVGIAVETPSRSRRRECDGALPESRFEMGAGEFNRPIGMLNWRFVNGRQPPSSSTALPSTSARVLSNSAGKPRSVKPTSKRWQPPEGLTPEEIDAIIAAAATERDRLLLSTLGDGGAYQRGARAASERYPSRGSGPAESEESEPAGQNGAPLGRPCQPSRDLLMWARENALDDDDPVFFSRQRTADGRRKAIDRVRAWQLVKSASERADVRVLALRATEIAGRCTTPRSTEARTSCVCWPRRIAWSIARTFSTWRVPRWCPGRRRGQAIPGHVRDCRDHRGEHRPPPDRVQEREQGPLVVPRVWHPASLRLTVISPLITRADSSRSPTNIGLMEPNFARSPAPCARRRVRRRWRGPRRDRQAET